MLARRWNRIVGGCRSARGIAGHCAARSVAVLALAGVASSQPADRSIDARVQAHFEAAQTAQAAGNYLSAAGEYESVVALRPDWALVRQSLGVVYHLAARYEQAIEQLREAVRIDSRLWGAWLFLGMDYYRVGRFEEAAGALSESLALNPGQPDARRWLGLSCAALQRYEEAIDHLSQVASSERADEDALFHLARAYDNRATQLFEQIGQADPDSPFVYLLQAERFAFDGEQDRARAEYRRALAIRPDLAGAISPDFVAYAGDAPASRVGARFATLRSAFAAGRYEDASAIAGKMLQSETDSTEASYWLGRSYKGLAAKAIDSLAEAAPDSYRVDQLEAESHAGRTEFAKALEAYGRALRKRPDLPGLRYAIGVVHWRAGQLDAARKWLGEELSRNPQHTLARHRLGSLLLDQGEAADALEHLLQAVSANSEWTEARFDLGRAFLESGDHASAVRELEAVAGAEPGHERARFLLAGAYRAAGRVEDAARELKLYQELSRERLQRVQRDVRSVSEDLQRDR